MAYIILCLLFVSVNVNGKKIKGIIYLFIYLLHKLKDNKDSHKSSGEIKIQPEYVS